MSGAVETRSWLTITVPYTTRETTLTGEDAGTFTTLDGRSGLSVLRAGVEVRIWTSNIHAAVARSWPIGHGQADHAKRLAEIGEAVGERLPLSPCDGAFLWEQLRAASDALAAAGIPEDGRSLAERVKALGEKAKPAESCSTCGEPYTVPPTRRAVVCSNGFHLCRDCTWSGGRRTRRCARHATLEMERAEILAASAAVAADGEPSR